ncbi:MAG: hypothetical protein ISS74_06875 [Planctomycetes bacterium]|nr:hypothetical protein [Planctomycetota bacterium]
MPKKKHKAKKVEPRPQNLVIGLTGPVGSGCSEMAATLKDKEGFAGYKISDAIRNVSLYPLTGQLKRCVKV